MVLTRGQKKRRAKYESGIIGIYGDVFKSVMVFQNHTRELARMFILLKAFPEAHARMWMGTYLFQAFLALKRKPEHEIIIRYFVGAHFNPHTVFVDRGRKAHLLMLQLYSLYFGEDAPEDVWGSTPTVLNWIDVKFECIASKIRTICITPATTIAGLKQMLYLHGLYPSVEQDIYIGGKRVTEMGDTRVEELFGKTRAVKVRRRKKTRATIKN